MILINLAGHRKCDTCKKRKLLARFHLNLSRWKHGRGYTCVPCARAKARAYGKDPATRARRKAYQSNYYLTTRKKAENAETQLLNEYGIDFEDWARMYERQGHTCAVCGDPLDFGPRTCVDHCHRTGKVRALLCNLCNSALGHSRERVDVLVSLIAYVRHHAQD